MILLESTLLHRFEKCFKNEVIIITIIYYYCFYLYYKNSLLKSVLMFGSLTVRLCSFVCRLHWFEWISGQEAGNAQCHKNKLHSSVDVRFFASHNGSMCFVLSKTINTFKKIKIKIPKTLSYQQNISQRQKSLFFMISYWQTQNFV